MDESLLKYDESLEALEKQRESLELVMKRMGAEWEESGAGIGWMGDILLHNSTSSHTTTTTTTATTTTTTTANTKSTTKMTAPPPLLHIMQSVSANVGPSHDYLQTLLNVNDELLAQSLASSIQDDVFIHNTQDYPLNYKDAYQQHSLISPPLSEQDNVSSSVNKSGNNTELSVQQQIDMQQLITPPITPPEKQ